MWPNGKQIDKNKNNNQKKPKPKMRGNTISVH